MAREALVYRPAIARAVTQSMIAAVIGGCSTIVEHSREPAPAPYAGTRSAIRNLERSWYDYDVYGQVYFYIIDTPFSFIADTVLYPLDHYRAKERAKKRASETAGHESVQTCAPCPSP